VVAGPKETGQSGFHEEDMLVLRLVTCSFASDAPPPNVYARQRRKKETIILIGVKE
jgi:hypothetical protein